MCVRVCVCVCVPSHGSRSVWSRQAGSGSVISHWILSQCPDTGRSSAGLWGQWRGLLLQDSHSVSSANFAPHLTWLHRPSDYFSVHRFSVCLRLGGELSKMITLCIKHAAVSNFSFPCLSSLPPPHLSLYPVSVSQIRWEKNITLGEPPGFLHSWWWYVYVEVLSSSWPHTRCFFNSSHSYGRRTLDGL